MLAEIIDRHDRRMIHLSDELSLALEALFSLGTEE